MNNQSQFGEDFNYNEIGKRNTSKHLLKSYGIDIEKAEGSRGGRVIGHTKSGKPIYNHFGENKDFTGEDHLDASTLHSKLRSDGQIQHVAHHEEMKNMHHDAAHEINDFGEGGKYYKQKAMTTGNTPGKETVEKGGVGSGRHVSKLSDEELSHHYEIESPSSNESHSERFKELHKELLNREKDPKSKFYVDKDKEGSKGGKVAHKKLSEKLKPISHEEKKMNEERGKSYSTEGKTNKELIAEKDKVQKSDLNKAFETLGVETIEKSEGSKGGQIIGHTKSGKPIYDSHHSPSEAYGKFTKQDHLDAVETNKKAHKFHSDNASAFSDTKSKVYNTSNTERSRLLAKKRRQAAEWHQGEVDNFMDQKKD